MRYALQILAAVCAFAICCPSPPGAAAAEAPVPKIEKDRQDKVSGAFLTDIPEYAGNVILGRPTDRSVTLSVLLRKPARVRVEYGLRGEPLKERTEIFDLRAGEPREIFLKGLEGNAAYEYQVLDADTGASLLPAIEIGTFRTARPAGAQFTFTIIADSHLDENTTPDLFMRTLANVAADSPDFHIDLGDTFMTEKYVQDFHAAYKQYLAQRYYFGLLHAPLFLVLGNHDGELGRYLDGTADSMPVWANTMRKKYFPNPVPDSYYTGNTTAERFGGQLQDYYAWQWGDALFVVLDPYWFTPRPGGVTDNWYRTLGAEQYQWLKRTLEQSHDTFKFVFIHNLVGGLGKDGRGGSEAVPFFEWGGKNLDGSEGFLQRRPGWPAPIHQLLLQNHVTIVFHGHDHLFAKQALDSIAYQTVPQPGDARGNTRNAAEYGYKGGVILGSSGHLRVAVSAREVKVEYVRADGSVAHSYTIPASRQP